MTEANSERWVTIRLIVTQRSKLKALLRKAAERTEEGLCDRIGQSLDTFTPQQCANYLAHAGYDQT